MAIISMWTFVGTVAACLTATAFLPQITVRLRHPEQARMSWGTLVFCMLGASLWTLYGVHLRDGIIIAANLFTLLTLVVLGLIQFLQEYRLPRA